MSFTIIKQQIHNPARLFASMDSQESRRQNIRCVKSRATDEIKEITEQLVTSVIFFAVCLLVAVPCWFNAIQVTHKGVVVANHYSWKATDDEQHNIHYYCSVKYNNGSSFCERIVGVNDNGDSGGMTQSKIDERLQNYCIMNSTKTVYTNYFTGKCELDYSNDSYNASVAFFVFAGLCGIFAILCLYALYRKYAIIREADRELQHMNLLTPNPQTPSCNVLQILPATPICSVAPPSQHCKLVLRVTPICSVAPPSQPSSYELVPTHHTDNDCKICLVEMQTNTKKFLVCGHAFHTMCINEWLATNNTCPICRTSQRIS